MNPKDESNDWCPDVWRSDERVEFRDAGSAFAPTKAKKLLVMETIRLRAKNGRTRWLLSYTDEYSTAVIRSNLTISEPGGESVVSAQVASGRRPWWGRGGSTNSYGTYWGAPINIVVDNGLAFIGEGLVRFCEDAGSNLIFIPSRGLCWKGRLEWLLAVIQKKFLHRHIDTAATNSRICRPLTLGENFSQNLWDSINKEQNSRERKGKDFPWSKCEASLAPRARRLPPLEHSRGLRACSKRAKVAYRRTRARRTP